MSFRTASLPVLEERLHKAGYAYSVEQNILRPMDPALAWMFMFEGNNLSPTDKPEHFNHQNTATATIGVWIAGSDPPRMLAFFRAMDARVERKRVYVPEPELATVAIVANGEVTFLPANRQLVPGRPIVGVVFRARDLEALNGRLQSAQIDRPPTLQTSAFRSIFLRPTAAHGTYLEFRQQK